MASTPTRPQIEAFHDPATWTHSYVLHAGPGTPCAVIDPVLDYDPKAGRTGHASADRLADFIQARGLQLLWILETHAHADHLSAASHLKARLGGQTAIGRQITVVQQTFQQLFHLEPGFPTDGSQFDRLLADGDTLAVGALTVSVMAVPGHTPACVAYRCADTVFVGDTLFMPDVGTARCDFPGGDAQALFASVQKLLSLPPDTRLYMCHDYPPSARPVAFESSVAEQRAHNIHVHQGRTAAEFVALRRQRDAGLDLPTLLLPSVQVNIRAGALPPPEANGVAYLKIPLNQL